MNIRRRTVGNVAVVGLSGELDSDSSSELGIKLARLLMENPKILIDFAGVTCVSSAGLRTMLLLYRQAQMVGHEVGVVGLSAEVHNVLEATGFLDYFTVSANVSDGVALMRTDTAREEKREHAISGA